MSTIDQHHGYAQAVQAIRAHTPPRTTELDKLERYVAGTQYHGMPDWLTAKDKPLIERGPNVVDPIVRKAIASYLDLMLGAGRWPAITSGAEEDDEPFDPRLKLSDDDSKALDQALRAVESQTKLQTAACDALEAAMSCGTVLTLASVRKGRLTLENLPAKHAEPKWSKADPDKLDAVEIRYPFLERYYDKQERKWAVRAMLYRRVIDEQQDTTYRPQPAPTDGDEPKAWSADPAQTIEHGFGFCPVIWYRFDRRCPKAGETDGRAIHAQLLGKIDALCRACSQHNRAGLYAGDPSLVEIGVDTKHVAAPTGQLARPVAEFDHVTKDGQKQTQTWNLRGGAPQVGCKSGVGVTRRYPPNDGKVEVKLMTLPADALDSLAKDRDDLRSQIAEALCWVRADMSTMTGPRGGGINFNTVSGVALRWLFRKQTARCDSYRDDFGDGWLLPVVGLLLRIVRHYAGRDGLYLAGAAEIGALVGRFLLPVTLPGGEQAQEWFAPQLRLDWGEYFADTAEDCERIAKQAREDYGAGLITLRSAVERIAEQYGIENLDEYLDTLKKEKDERAEGLHKAIDALQNGQAQEGPGGMGAGAQAQPGADGAAGSPAKPGTARGAASRNQRGNGARRGIPAQGRAASA
jgi:hypothetical protein